MGSLVALSYMNGKNDLKSKNSPHSYTTNPITGYLATMMTNPKKKTKLPFIFPFFVKKLMVLLKPMSKTRPTMKANFLIML